MRDRGWRFRKSKIDADERAAARAAAEESDRARAAEASLADRRRLAEREAEVAARGLELSAFERRLQRQAQNAQASAALAEAGALQVLVKTSAASTSDRAESAADSAARERLDARVLAVGAAEVANARRERELAERAAAVQRRDAELIAAGAALRRREEGMTARLEMERVAVARRADDAATLEDLATERHALLDAATASAAMALQREADDLQKS